MGRPRLDGRAIQRIGVCREAAKLPSGPRVAARFFG
jgi:hypothetical protein